MKTAFCTLSGVVVTYLVVCWLAAKDAREMRTQFASEMAAVTASRDDAQEKHQHALAEIDALKEAASAHTAETWRLNERIVSLTAKNTELATDVLTARKSAPTVVVDDHRSKEAQAVIDKLTEANIGLARRAEQAEALLGRTAPAPATSGKPLVMQVNGIWVPYNAAVPHDTRVEVVEAADASPAAKETNAERIRRERAATNAAYQQKQALKDVFKQAIQEAAPPVVIRAK